MSDLRPVHLSDLLKFAALCPDYARRAAYGRAKVWPGLFDGLGGEFDVAWSLKKKEAADAARGKG